MSQIRVAESAGFCPGCERATKMAEKTVGEGKTLLTLGELVHNEVYLEELRRKGVQILSPDGFPLLEERLKKGEEISLLIRAHGEEEGNLEILSSLAEKYPSLTVLDGTCPYVRKLREIARNSSGDGKMFLLMGKANHPETRGVLSCCRGPYLVFESEKELREKLKSLPEESFETVLFSLAAQTTMRVSEWKKTCAFLEKVYTKLQIFDTICGVTEKRQAESARLAAESDAVLVIGSRNSSNTMELFELCREICPRTYLVERASDVLFLPLSPTDRLSVTAGASTPSSLIQEVRQTMSETMENFEELLEQSLKTLSTGEIVEGVITSISGNEVHLDLGTKTTGVIAREKLTDDPQVKLTDLFKIGDVIKAKVVKVSDIDGIATLDKLRADAEANWVNILEAEQTGEVLEGKVVEVTKGGVIVSVNGVRVFVPASHTGIPKDGDLSPLMGTEQKIVILEVKKDRRRALGSIRKVLQAERKAKEKEFWDNIEVGKVYEGTVKSLTAYGAFVDLGGVDGMVHVTELSWRHIHNPAEVVKVGDPLRVFVKSFDREKGRISLGYKTPETDPWLIFRGQYNVGDVVTVKIVSLTTYGAFAEIVKDVDGLIHISQIADHKIATPAEILSVGQEVDAKIIAIDEEKRKVSLSIRALIEEVVAAEQEKKEEAEAPAVFSTDEPETLASFEEEEK